MAQNITEYAAPNKLGEVSDRASSAHVGAGRRIAMQYNEAGQAYDSLGRDIGGTVQQLGKAYLDYQTHKEVSAGGLHASSLALNATQAWNDTVKDSDPNDPTVQPKFLGGLEKQLDKFRESFSTEEGQKWADHRANTIREHFNNITTADVSSMAGVAIHNNAVQSVNNYTALVDKDPSSIGLAHDLFKQDINDLVMSSPTLKGAAAQKVLGDVTQKGMEQIVKAAVFSSIRKGGDGSEIADDPKFSPYVNSIERGQMVTAQRQEERLARTEERYQKQQAKEQKQDQSDETVMAIVRDLNSDSPTMSKRTINDLADQGKFTPRGYEHAIGIFERATKEETPARISAENSNRLLERMRLPPGDPNRLNTLDDLYDARIKGAISKADFNDLAKQFTDLRTPDGQKLGAKMNDFFNQYKGTITKSIVGSSVDKDGDIKFYQFKDEAERKVDEYRRAGKNPYDLFNPKSPDFLGSPDTLKQYISPLDQRVRDSLGRIKQGGTAPDKRPPLSSFDGSR